jgi:hypothetical protein
MATDAAIAAAILAAQTLGVTPAGMVALIDQKIAEWLAEAGIVGSYSAEGRALTRNIEAARQLRVTYLAQSAGSAPVTAVAEFVSG